MGSSFEAKRRFEANKLSGVCGEEASSDHLFSRLPTRCGAQQFIPELAEGSQRADRKVLTHEQGRPTRKCPALLSVFYPPSLLLYSPPPTPTSPGFGRRPMAWFPVPEFTALEERKLKL